DCIAPYTALKLFNENNLLNINGGYTIASYEKPFISYIGPHGIERNGLYQIYAAQMNENVYTNLWNGPYWGFEKVLETQEITDKPLRLKPINIYYHFYSASKYESLNTLKKIYETSLKKEVILKYTSDYIKTVLDFYNSEMFNYENKWLITSNGYIKTIKTKKILKINESVCGYRKINNLTYYHLCSKPPYKLEINDDNDEIFSQPYLEFSNAEIDYFKKDNNIYLLKLKGYLPIKYKIINAKKIEEKDYKEGIHHVKEIKLQK
ncbi:MAG: hypothetical protein N2114_03195, partial [Candidatus Goldbacteria bacterium]|nr:hypothetical protein [Candidatus Goldiibacteriota bacterium]